MAGGNEGVPGWGEGADAFGSCKKARGYKYCRAAGMSKGLGDAEDRLIQDVGISRNGEAASRGQCHVGGPL